MIERGSKLRRRLWILLEAFLSLMGMAASPAATLAISAVLGWTALQISGQTLEWDSQFYLLINGWSRPEVTGLILLLLNDPGIDYVAIIVPILVYVWLRRRRETPWAVIAVVIALVMGSLTIPPTQLRSDWGLGGRFEDLVMGLFNISPGQQLGLRVRPFVSITAAIIDPEWRKIWLLFPTFPSGHLRETVGLGIVLAYFWPAARWPAAIYSFIVAFTRLYLGAHFPSDVAAGGFIGVMDGFVAVFTVNRLDWFLRLAGGLQWMKRAYRYVFLPRSPGRWSQDPWPARSIRLTLFLGALMGGAYLGGQAVNFQGLRIIYDLMRNFDNSVTNPLLVRFDPQWAEGFYQALGNGQAVYPVLALLAVLVAARRGWRELARGVLVVALTSLLVYSVLELMGTRFDRSLPYAQLENSLPQEWRLPWASLSAFPQRHIMAVAALAVAMAHFARPLLPLAYAYTLAVAGALLYFGAAWPTDIVISLLVGQGAARYAAFLSQNLMPEAVKRAPAPVPATAESSTVEEGEAAAT